MSSFLMTKSSNKKSISQSFQLKFRGRKQSDQLQALVCIPNSTDKDITFLKPLQSIFITKISILESLSYLQMNKVIPVLVFNVTIQKVILRSYFHSNKREHDILESTFLTWQLRKT